MEDVRTYIMRRMGVVVRLNIQHEYGRTEESAAVRALQNVNLTIGEMQRVAIGRAIVHRPRLILADEPTGNLDSHTGEQILDLIRQVHRAHRPTIVMATHSDRAASYGDSIVQLMDGAIVDGSRPA